MSARALSIGPAQAADVDAVARLLCDCLADKYRPAFGRHAHDVVTALMRAEMAAGIDGYRVARNGDTVVGVLHMAGAEDVERMDWFGTVRRAAGWWGALRAECVLRAIAHGPLHPREMYLGEVAVHPDHRRQGVASALLACATDEARARGRESITLWVTWENDSAHALYRRHGFVDVRRRRWRWARLMFRARGATLMERNV